MEYVYLIGSRFLGIGLFFLILNGAIRNTHYKTKGIVNLSVGIILVIIFLVSFLIDYHGDSLFNYLEYFGLLFASLFFAILLGLGNFRSVRDVFSKSPDITNTHHYTEYLYVVYRNQTDLYLQRKKELLQGLLIKLKKTDFHDDIIKKLNEEYLSNRYRVLDSSILRLGKVTLDKQKAIYYCFVIEINESVAIDGLEKVNAYQVVNQSLDEFNKQIIYRIILREEFELRI